jgi:hypothetical protein
MAAIDQKAGPKQSSCQGAIHTRFELNGERISRLPDVDGDKPARAKFKRYPIGV